jgi:squalene-associated FAD-dependent desaturase
MKGGVAVLGAGWAGLAAAVELAHHGMTVTVFESAPQAGGRARAVKLRGIALDNGQHILLGAYRQTLALMARVNPRWREGLLRLPLTLRVEPGVRLAAPRLPAPWHLAAALLRAQGLAWRDRLAALRLFASLRRHRFQLDEDTSVAHFLAARRQTERLARFLWHPLCLAALNTPPEIASAQVFVNVLHDALARSRTDSDLLLPRVNLSALFPQPAAAYLLRRGGSLLLGQRVESLARTEGGWRVETRQGSATFPQVICALPPKAAARLLSPLPGMEAVAREISGLAPQPIHTVYLRYGARLRLPAPMLGLARGPGQWVFDRQSLTGEAGLLAVVISAEGPHDTWDHARLAQTVARQLTEQLGLPQPEWTGVIGEKQATFSCTPGLSRPGSQTPLPGLLLAGDYVAAAEGERDYPATIEGAVRSGVQCARHILGCR